MPRSPIEVRPRIRVLHKGEILLGPGKADLLDAIDRTGSIRQAALELGMSYMRAWTLVRTMNDGFKSPLVERLRGGADRGGARLTRTGRAVLEIYREMQTESSRAIEGLARRVRRLVRRP